MIGQILSFVLLANSAAAQWTLSVQELTGFSLANFAVSGWLDPNGNSPEKVEKCTQILMKLYQQKLTKSFRLADEDFDQVRVEFELYLFNYVDTSLSVKLDTTTQHLLFNGEDLQADFCQEPGVLYKAVTLTFETNVKQFNLEFIFQSNQNTQLGIRNLNIQTNGVILQSQCPYDKPIQDTSGNCATQCQGFAQQLNSTMFPRCGRPSIVADVFRQQLNIESNLIFQQDTNFPNDMIKLDIFRPENNMNKVIYFNTFAASQGVQQLQVVLYVFGGWKDGSTLEILLTNYNATDSFAKIQYQNGRFYSNLYGTKFTKTILQLQNGTQIASQRLLIISEKGFLALGNSFWTLFVNQNLIGSDASYAFQNIQLYVTKRSNSQCQLFQGQICRRCRHNRYQYLGLCFSTCPKTTVPFLANGVTPYNCTDLDSHYTIQFYPSLTVNAKGIYLQQTLLNNSWDFTTLDFKGDGFAEKSLFYSFAKNNRILGGYRSWKDRSISFEFSDLPFHYQLRLYVKLYFIDQWSGSDLFTIQIDGQSNNYDINGLTPQQISGSQILDYEKSVFIVQPHLKDTVKVTFICKSMAASSTDSYCGIGDLSILVDQNEDYTCPALNEFLFTETRICEKCSIFCPNGCWFHLSNCKMKCNSPCATCQNTDKSKCLTCDPSIYREIKGNECLCQEGYFNENNRPDCTKCDVQCKTCSSLSECLSCDITKDRIEKTEDNKLTCPCKEGYFDVPKQSACAKCDVQCKSCSSTFQCLSCDSMTNRIETILDNKLLCPCKIGYYEDSQHRCQSCARNCLKCTALACQECDKARNFTLQDQGCQCISGTTLVDDICQTTPAQCPQNCIKCESSTVCSVCLRNYFLTQQQVCVPLICHQTCLTCVSPYINGCLTCPQNQNRSLELGQCNCILGYSEDRDGNCKINDSCHYSCKLCTKSDSKEHCLTCPNQEVSHRVFKDYQCLCEEGYKDQVGYQNCFKCQTWCRDCRMVDSRLQCTQCPENMILHENGCYCVAGYYQESQTICSACNGVQTKYEQQCQYVNYNDGMWNYGEQCDDGNQVPRDGCTDFLIDKQWTCLNVIDKPSICTTCSKFCTTCNLNGCIACNSGYFYNNEICLACHPKCKQCIEKNSCTSCKLGSPPDCEQCKNELGYYFDGYQCSTKCGDGIRAGNEECDDGNNLNFDGCSNSCLMQHGFSCLSLGCVQNPLPKKSIQYADPFTTNVLVVQLQNINTDCHHILPKIETFTESDFNYTILDRQNSELLECSINLNFFREIKQVNLIKLLIKLKSKDLNNQSRMLQDIELVLTVQLMPRPVKIYNEVQVSRILDFAAVYKRFNDIITLYLPLSFMLISNQYYFALLDFLVWLDYFYFMEISFPLSLEEILKIKNFEMYKQTMSLKVKIDETEPLYNKLVTKNITPSFENYALFSCFFLSLLFLILINFGVSYFVKKHLRLALRKTKKPNNHITFNYDSTTHFNQQCYPKNKIFPLPIDTKSMIASPKNSFKVRHPFTAASQQSQETIFNTGQLSQDPQSSEFKKKIAPYLSLRKFSALFHAIRRHLVTTAFQLFYVFFLELLFPICYNLAHKQSDKEFMVSGFLILLICSLILNFSTLVKFSKYDRFLIFHRRSWFSFVIFMFDIKRVGIKFLKKLLFIFCLVFFDNDYILCCLVLLTCTLLQLQLQKLNLMSLILYTQDLALMAIMILISIFVMNRHYDFLTTTEENIIGWVVVGVIIATIWILFVHFVKDFASNTRQYYNLLKKQCKSE